MSDKEGDGSAAAGGKRSAWMTHVKKTMRSHRGMKLMQVLKLAKKTYKKKGMRGGFTSSAGAGASTAADVSSGAATGGRRRSRKSKKGSRRH